jgi:malic enzyme
MSFAPITAAAALSLARDGYYGAGKIEILPKMSVACLRDIAVAFTPGVGHVVRHLMENPRDSATDREGDPQRSRD